MKNLLQGNSNPDPPNKLQVEMNASNHWTTPVSAANSSLKEEFLPSLW